MLYPDRTWSGGHTLRSQGRHTCHHPNPFHWNSCRWASGFSVLLHLEPSQCTETTCPALETIVPKRWIINSAYQTLTENDTQNCLWTSLSRLCSPWFKSSKVKWMAGCCSNMQPFSSYKWDWNVDLVELSWQFVMQWHKGNLFSCALCLMSIWENCWEITIFFLLHISHQYDKCRKVNFWILK